MFIRSFIQEILKNLIQANGKVSQIIGGQQRQKDAESRRQVSKQMDIDSIGQ
jgi:hypothetical protein